MNHRQIKRKVIKAKFIQELSYLTYRFKSAIGIKTIGFGKYEGLIVMKLARRYKPSIYTFHVASTDKNLASTDLYAIHDYGIRLCKTDYLSIILNPTALQVKVVTGDNLRAYIDEPTEKRIAQSMLNKVEQGEILAGLEIGMKKIKECLKEP